MSQPPPPRVPAVDANRLVCVRCGAVPQLTQAPDVVNRYSWFTWRRGYQTETVRTRSYSVVCGDCGSSELVPAGTPRGREILAQQGIAVTGKLHSRPVSGCAVCFFGLLAVASLVALGEAVWPSKSHDDSSSDDTYQPSATHYAAKQGSPVEAPEPPAPAGNRAKPAPVATAQDNAKSKSEKAVFEFHRQRAMAGEPGSMFRLAQLYLIGSGCNVDTNAAKEWLQKAADQNYPGAKEELQDLP